MDKVLLCTHNTLLAVYKKLKENNQLELLNNLLLWIDEAHHIKNVSVEGFEDAVISNGLGELVSYALNEPTIQVGLSTAFFFRGDRLTLLTKAMEERFSRYNLPYDIYLASMKYLESFSFDFMLCGPDYSKAIELIIKSRKGKDIIHIPHPCSNHSTGNKYQEVSSIIEKYKNVHGGEIVESPNGLTLLVSEDSEFKICDLVDEDRRFEKKEYLARIENKDDLDAIIALGMFKEGADWPLADRSIIVGCRSSLQDVGQIVGRLFRDVEGKKSVEVIQLLPFSLDQSDEEFRVNLNNYLKAIFASLILENVLNPPKIKIKNEDEIAGDTEDQISGDEKSKNWLGEKLDDAEQLSLIEEIINSLLAVSENVSLWDEYQKIIPDILENYGVTDHIEEISKQIWIMFTRPKLKLEGINVEDIDFEILQKTSPLEFILRYTSDSCGIDTFAKLRDAIAKRKTPDEWVVAAEQLAKQNKGILPCLSFLNKNGYSGLVQAIRNHPEKFVHIKQENKKGKTLDEWVVVAEEMARENNGILPSYTFLVENGYFGLIEFIRNHPEKFAHLKQEKKKKTLNEWVVVAEEMARENNGILPSVSILMKENLFSGLIIAIQKYPEKFAHIKQESKSGKTSEEWVVIAEQIAKENKGILPNAAFLIKIGYRGLVRAILEYPEKFAHLKQEKKRKTPDEWVAIAEQIAKKNKGILPYQGFLIKNGYGGLVQAMFKHPEKFTHIIKQKSKK